MLSGECLYWMHNPEWFERVFDDNDEFIETRLTDKAPPEAVESFKLYQERKSYAREHGIVY